MLKAPRQCSYVGCYSISTNGSRCNRHPKKAFDNFKRTNAKDYTHNRRWRKLRDQYIQQHPLCVHCKGKGRVKEAQVIDHILSIKNGGSMWDQGNLQALCHRCHNKKSATERKR